MHKNKGLKDFVDSIVVLGDADSFVELGDSHVLIRLAEFLPVLVVQPDLPGLHFVFEETKWANVALLHVHKKFNAFQSELVNEALLARSCIRPLIWVQSACFEHFLEKRYSVLNVFYCSEDYFSSSASAQTQQVLQSYVRTLSLCQLIITSSQLLQNSLRANLVYQGHYQTVSDNSVEEVNALQQTMEKMLLAQQPKKSKLKVALFYEPFSVGIQTVQEYLDSFGLFSRHQIAYLPAVRGTLCAVDLNAFDVLVLHYSVRVSLEKKGIWFFSPSHIKAIKGFGGYKVLYLQDEYEGTNNTRYWIRQLGFHTVYTCVPSQYIEAIYPKAEFPKVHFITVLTGYVPEDKFYPIQCRRPSERTVLIGYRGRDLHYCYGSLAQEKLMIGVRIKEYCEKKSLPVDIEWDASKRIYGPAWYEFLAGCRATLGTESGANVFDWDGSIRANLDKLLSKNPKLRFEDVYEEYIKPHEQIKMNQISPKIFESILLKTALVLFEGAYSGILVPDVHYIPLKKDFSNIEEVLLKIQDDALVDQLTDRAYSEIIASGFYSYARFVADFDEHLVSEMKQRQTGKRSIWMYTISEAETIKKPQLPLKNKVKTLTSDRALTWDQVLALDPPPIRVRIKLKLKDIVRPYFSEATRKSLRIGMNSLRGIFRSEFKIG